MICATCKAANQTSRVFDRGGSTTAAYYQPFYDEDGKYHHHDGNVTTTAYECSNGHRWTEQSMGSCWCGWPDKKDEAPPPVVGAEKVQGNIVLVGAGSGLVQEHEPLRLDRVWIVSEGCRYEGSETHSVHATRKSASVAAEELRQQRDGPWLAATDNTDVFSLWRNGMNYITVREWLTTKEKP